jgi:heme-degrading monooxygenase HmoA
MTERWTTEICSALASKKTRCEVSRVIFLSAIFLSLLSSIGETMIARIWHGKTKAASANVYRDFLRARAAADYQAIAGNLGAHILQSNNGDVAHFLTLTFWESTEAVKAFAGDDFEKAKYYPEDQNFLLEFEPRVAHYEVVGKK